MNRLVAALAGVIGIVLIAYALLSGKTDEELIVERLDELASAVQVDDDTSTNLVLRAGAVQGQFEEIFTDDLVYDIPELSSSRGGRTALARMATQASGYLDALGIGFGNTDVDLEPGADRAEVRAIATVYATHRGGRVERDDRVVTFEFRKVDDEWRIARLEVAAK